MKRIREWYPFVVLFLFVLSNFVFRHIVVTGSLYRISMLLVIFINFILVIKFKKSIKRKSPFIIIYFLMCIFCKNALNLYFSLSNILAYIIAGFMESHFVKALTIIIISIATLFFLPLTFIFLLLYSGLDGTKSMHDVYSDTHYICENDYEIYSFSMGAMDGFHYSVGKYHEFLRIDDILEISYRKRNETTQEIYEEFLENNDCMLAEEIHR